MKPAWRGERREPWSSSPSLSSALSLLAVEHRVEHCNQHWPSGGHRPLVHVVDIGFPSWGCRCQSGPWLASPCLRR
jgi:hypothetical protein